MPKELWKPVPGLPGREISNLGRLRHGPRIYRTGCYGTNGRSATVKINSVPTNVRIARLVGAAFCDDYQPDRLPVHRNKDKGDCRAINLQWVPRSQVTGIPYSRNPRQALRAGDEDTISDKTPPITNQ